MNDLEEINRLAQLAKSRADSKREPFLVCWGSEGAQVVPARDYSQERYGAVECVRYPDGYQHPPLTGNRLW